MAMRREGKTVMNSPVPSWSKKEEGRKSFRCWSTLQPVENHWGADGYFLKDCIFWRAHMGVAISEGVQPLGRTHIATGKV